MKKIIVTCMLVVLLAAVSGCANKAQQGAGTGALVGATIGALASGDKVTGALIGAGAGMLLGYMIGNEMDKYDQQQVNSTLEHSPSGQTSTWQNPDTGAYYQATPEPAYYEDDKIYRDVELQATVDGKTETVNAKAYRNADGTWSLVQ